MGYRGFTEKTTFDDASDGLVFTEAALLAHEDDEIRSLAETLTSLLEKGDALVAERTAARRELVRANARVRAADALSDDEVTGFAKDVLGEARQDRTAEVYVAFFGKLTPTAVIAMSLAPESEEIARFIEVLGGKSASKPLRATWTPRWKRVLERGNAALASRKAAQSKLTEASVEVTRWIERADRARRGVDGALTQYAAEHGHDRDFNARFFPNTPSASKKKSGGATPSATEGAPA